MVPRALLPPIVLGLASSARGAVHSLHSRAVQVAAICTPDFAWMDTQNQVSPCSVNANLNAVCNGGSWAIPALNSSFNYALPGNPPGSNTTCTCSWASYNTISACAACQGFASGVAGWDAYIQNCNGLVDTSKPFPSNLAPALAQGFAVPFWATQDPTQWPNRRFDFPTAKSIQAQGHADVVLNPGVSQGKKKAPVGPIVGGVIGGIVVLVAAILVFLFIVRRKKNTKPSGPNVSTLGHLRSTSDVSSKAGFMSTTGYATLTNSTPMYTNAPSSPTIMTHGASSIRSMPFNSVIASSIPPTSSPPIPTSSPPPVPIAREDIIVPFTSRPSTPDRDRKHPNGPGAAFPIYDSPTAPPNQRPSIIQINGSVPNTPAQRGRINPPAYQESSPGATTPSSSSGNGQRRGPPHAKKGSADTHDSTSSGLPPVRYPGGHVPAAHPPSSMFATDLSRGDTITSTHTNMTGYSRGEGPSAAAVATVGHGRTVGGSRDEKRDPSSAVPPAGGSGVRDSTTINASDIA